MQLDATTLLDTTVTILCRVGAKDTGAKADVYNPIVIYPAMWSERMARTQDSDGTVHTQNTVTVQVPASSAEFLSYEGYCAKVKAGELGGVYTANVGDFVAKGALGSSPLTKAEAIKAIAGLPHATVTAVRDCRNNGAVSHALTGAEKYASMVQVEGV